VLLDSPDLHEQDSVEAQAAQGRGAPGPRVQASVGEGHQQRVRRQVHRLSPHELHELVE
jgi:hypothetical protein